MSASPQHGGGRPSPPLSRAVADAEAQSLRAELARILGPRPPPGHPRDEKWMGHASLLVSNWRADDRHIAAVLDAVGGAGRLMERPAPAVPAQPPPRFAPPQIPAAAPAAPRPAVTSSAPSTAPAAAPLTRAPAAPSTPQPIPSRPSKSAKLSTGERLRRFQEITMGRGLNATQRLLADVLWSFAVSPPDAKGDGDRRGEAWPSQRELARRMEMTTENVRKATRKLEEKGIIRVRHPATPHDALPTLSGLKTGVGESLYLVVPEAPDDVRASWSTEPPASGAPATAPAPKPPRARSR